MAGDVSAAAAAGQNVPEETVVGMAATVVADGSAYLVGYGGEVGNKVFDGLRLEFGVALDGGVEGIDVGGVMLAVMDFHGPGVEVWFEGIVSVWEVGQ